MRRVSFRACAAALALSSAVEAQLAWSNRQPSPAPPARRQHAMWTTLLFGGSGASGLLQDTWEWNGGTWTQRSSIQIPPARQEHAMAPLPGFGAIVLFGGFTGTSAGFLQDTWIWTGSFWSPRTTVPSPPARKGHTLTYDPKSKRVILFGGNDNLGPRSDTWAWTGNQWLQLQPLASPPPRGGHAAAYDENQDRIVVFGGFGAAPLADTWAFDGTTWTQLAPAVSPSPRAYHAMIWDSLRRRTVLFGGDSVIPGGALNDTWDFIGDSPGTWTLRAPSGTPPARRDHSLAYDAFRDEVVLFGGSAGSPSQQLLQDTRTLASTSPARVMSFGQGCMGTSVTPAFLPPLELPWLGSAWEQEAVVVSGQPATAFLGTSATTWGGLPLPLDLGPLGALNCYVYASLEVALPLAPVGNVARVKVPVPNDAGLVGRSVFAQVVSRDPGANPLGYITSNAVDVRVGWR